MASTWSSVSRLSKSSERHVSPLCDPRCLLLFGRPSDSLCDPGIPCGRSSDRLLPPRVLFAARPILLLGRSPADFLASPVRLSDSFDGMSGLAIASRWAATPFFGSLSCSSSRLLLYPFLSHITYISN